MYLTKMSLAMKYHIIVSIRTHSTKYRTVWKEILCYKKQRYFLVVTSHDENICYFFVGRKQKIIDYQQWWFWGVNLVEIQSFDEGYWLLLGLIPCFHKILFHIKHVIYLLWERINQLLFYNLKHKLSLSSTRLPKDYIIVIC